MNEIVPVNPGSGAAQLDRRGSKSLQRTLGSLDRSKAVGMARIEVQAELQAAKAHAIGFVGQQGMQAVAMLSQLEGQLGQACPMAVTRLQGIADMTAMSIAQVIADSTRRIGA